MTLGETDSPDSWLVELPPSARQSWSAVAVAGAVFIAFLAVIPFTGRTLIELNALFPSLDAIAFITDLITAVLLFAQFSISRSRSLFVLANGYLFTALILGFAAGLLGYTILKQEKRAPTVSETSARRAIGWSVSAVFVLVCGLTWLATGGVTLLPPIILPDGRGLSSLVIYPIWFTILISAAPTILLLTRRSVLDQWLMVVALAFILELVLSGLLASVRFGVGFYAGRAFSLVTSSLVLIILLSETTRLYARLSRSNRMLRRERDSKLLTLEAMAAAFAHEIKQPLTAITFNGSAALKFLNQTPPDLEEVELALKDTIVDGHRASQILDSIRELFGKSELKKERIDVNSLTREVLRALESDIASHRIETRVELASELPPIMGHKGQLQEVIINLVHNAIEAMDAVDGDRILKVGTDLSADEEIAVVVEDTGPGLSSEEANTIFEAFVTTKSHGMGLGLAICRMIVERHEGRLSVSSADPRGAIFRVTLPKVGLSH